MEDQQEKETPMQEERVFFEQTATAEKEGGRGKIWAVVLLIVLLLSGLVGWFIVKGRGESGSSSPTPQSTVVEQSTPTPTPEAISKEQIRIEILNGTGISGEAAVLKGRLIPLGYSTITAGNATTQDNTVSEISFSQTVPESVRTELLGLLNEMYESVRTGSTITQNQVDVRIITGLRKGATPKPSPTATPKASPTASPKASASPTPTPSITP